jgi:hypothetical protein
MFHKHNGMYSVKFMTWTYLVIINHLNAELNPTCHLLALLGGATIVVVSRLRVNCLMVVIQIFAPLICNFGGSCYSYLWSGHKLPCSSVWHGLGVASHTSFGTHTVGCKLGKCLPPVSSQTYSSDTAHCLRDRNQRPLLATWNKTPFTSAWLLFKGNLW